MNIIAAFDKVIFCNADSKYTVARLKTADRMIPEDAKNPYKYRDHLIRFTAVGYDLPQTDAIQIELDGEWVDGKFGKQLQVKHWHEIVPPTIEGIRGYLGSGLLKGIGEKTAENIIQRFGAKSLYVLEHQPERLLEIRGITEERLAEIKTGYAESKSMRDLMTLLAPFKVTPATAIKIYQHFGPGGVQLLRENPFLLCQVSGFGFRRVDAIVQKSGGDLHSPKRIQGALFYALEKSRSEDGHLYLPSEKLIASALQLLNEKIPIPDMRIAPQKVEKELEAMILMDVVVSNKSNIYLPHVFRQESEMACKVVEMLMTDPEPVNLAPVMECVKRQLGIVLSPKQSAGVEMVFQHNLSIITGGPGTGKSTILKAVVEAYRMLYPKHKITLGAPTGKASRRMAETTGIQDAQTLHSILELRGENSGRQKKEPLNADLLIVDETSMMDMWLAHQLFMRLRPETKVLLVGDADQLESVGAGNVFHELIESGLVPVTVLDEIFRQAQDSPIAHNAKAINEGKSELIYRADFNFIRADTQEIAAEMVRELYKQEITKTGMEQVQILSAFRERGEASADHLNESIREEVNPSASGRAEIISGSRTFRVGDRVIQTKNNYDIELKNLKGERVSVGIFNGEIGIIHAVQPEKVIIRFDGRYAEYLAQNLDDLELSYATTIHKSMGSEYDTVIIPLLAAQKVMLTRNLLYTAVTRAKRRVILVGQKKALFMAIAKSRTGKRNTLLGERIRLYYQALANKKADGRKLRALTEKQAS